MYGKRIEKDRYNGLYTSSWPSVRSLCPTAYGAKGAWALRAYCCVTRCDFMRETTHVKETDPTVRWVHVCWPTNPSLALDLQSKCACLGSAWILSSGAMWFNAFCTGIGQIPWIRTDHLVWPLFNANTHSLYVFCIQIHGLCVRVGRKKLKFH